MAVILRNSVEVARITHLINAGVTDINVVMAWLHWLTHQGLLFEHSDSQELALNAKIEFLVVTTTAASLDFGWDISGKEFTLKITEGVTDTPGNPITVFNKNRNSPITLIAGFNLVGTPSGGTLIVDRGAGSGLQVVAESREQGEWVFKPSTIYHVEIQSGVATNFINARFTMYDVQEGERP